MQQCLLPAKKDVVGYTLFQLRKEQINVFDGCGKMHLKISPYFPRHCGKLDFKESV